MIRVYACDTYVNRQTQRVDAETRPLLRETSEEYETQARVVMSRPFLAVDCWVSGLQRVQGKKRELDNE
jgi:hypothetical protein